MAGLVLTRIGVLALGLAISDNDNEEGFLERTLPGRVDEQGLEDPLVQRGAEGRTTVELCLFDKLQGLNLPVDTVALL